jgi:hypothetical protein
MEILLQQHLGFTTLILLQMKVWVTPSTMSDLPILVQTVVLHWSFPLSQEVAWQSLMELLQLGLGEQQQQQLQLRKLIKAAAWGEVKYLGSSSTRDQQQRE